MKILRQPSFLIIILALAFCPFSFVQAEIHTYVSTNGMDTNSCTQAQPCRTFTGALAKTDNGGDITVLDTGQFEPVVITKSVSIIVPQGISAGITTAENPLKRDGIVIDPGAPSTISLNNLSIYVNSGGDGIRIKGTTGSVASISVTIENCIVSKPRQASAAGIRISENAAVTIKDTTVQDAVGSGIVINSKASWVSVEGGTIHNNAQTGDMTVHGIDVKAGTLYARKATISNNGGMGISIGPGASVMTNVTVEDDSLIIGNYGGGIRANMSGGSLDLDIIDSSLSFNGNTAIECLSYGSNQCSVSAVQNNILNNKGSGIHGGGSGTTVILDGNNIQHNYVGVARSPGSMFPTDGGNIVSENTENHRPPVMATSFKKLKKY